MMHLFSKRFIRQLVGKMLLFALIKPSVICQNPFKRTGQVFLINQFPNELVEFTVSPAGNSLNFNPLQPNPLYSLDALGYRKTDNLLYAIATNNNHLIQIDANGNLADMGALPLQPTLLYLAGDITPDGKFLISVGSEPNGNDVHLAITDLESANYTTNFIDLNGNTMIADIAVDPFSSIVYGYDALNRNIININSNTGAITEMNEILNENTIQGLYFDAFGDLYAYGRSVSGIVDALFLIDKLNGKEKRLATGPNAYILDAASCPFSIELKSQVSPTTTLPCTEIEVAYTLGNGSGETISGVDFLQELPIGFYLSGILQNQLGILADTMSQLGAIRFNDINLGPGIKKLVLKLNLSNLAEGQYNAQAKLQSLPNLYGLTSYSDNVWTGGFEDSSSVLINRADNDTLSYYWFVCHGEELLLDGSQYGNSIIWSTGATAPQISVSQGDVYFANISTRCESFQITHDVTSASCPFTISLFHIIEPDSIFACSDVIFRYVLSNASGEPRENVSILDSLPTGFSFIEMLKSPAGTQVTPNTPPEIISLQHIDLKVGKDTIDIKVHIDEVPPGNQFNKAVLFDLPRVMGPIRNSDYPKTPIADATPIFIKGAISDSLRLDTVVCQNSEILLDANAFGQDFRWQNGSIERFLAIKEPGFYQLTVFDGCEPADIFWEVDLGTKISIEPENIDSIHQGESIILTPIILNEGNSLNLEWLDPNDNTLSCNNCINPTASPLTSTIYTLLASNQVCSDTANFHLLVDDERRIYAPTAFSPNGDGINDLFYLQSPDYGDIKQFQIFDRWGGLVFSSNTSQLNVEPTGWDGSKASKLSNQNMYVWTAEIEFIDGKSEIFSGEVILLW